MLLCLLVVGESRVEGVVVRVCLARVVCPDVSVDDGTSDVDEVREVKVGDGLLVEDREGGFFGTLVTRTGPVAVLI